MGDRGPADPTFGAKRQEFCPERCRLVPIADPETAGGVWMLPRQEYLTCQGSLGVVGA
jgi:hypothetical protein